ncbi:MAG: class Ib ribonucleoside-diphosphate reductase assembly flavoprotein NrdI [Micrococcaceae bacterium]
MAESSPHPRSPLPFRELSEEESSDLVYFSSVSENTHRFVERLNHPAVRIPLRPRIEGMIRVCRPYVLIVPTYGSGSPRGAIPPQVQTFLNDAQNRALIRGVVTAGNTNFGSDYCLAGRVISAKCSVPELYRFELLGTSDDVRRVSEGLQQFWAEVTTTHATTPSRTP